MGLKELKHNYAKVLIEIGAGLMPGQILCAEAPIDQKEFVDILAYEAYNAGCSQFVPIWKDEYISRLSVEKMKQDYINSSQPLADYYASKKAAFIRLECPNLEFFEGLNIEATKWMTSGDGNIRRVFRSSGRNGHTLGCLPCKSWAKLVYPELGESDGIEKLWNDVFLCTRCYEKDPVGAWKRHVEGIIEHKKLLDEKNFTAFHFYGGKTDFFTSPAEGDHWMGGCSDIKESIRVPNIPTEEVFISPHKYKVNGVIASTMPLVYSGQIIDNIKLVIKNGKIIESYAEKGEELLKSIIETDDGSHYLGEIAFVEQSSPIASIGRTFYTTLYDENASCHVAIGSAYSGNISDKEKERRGYNVSSTHVDFMIGHDTLCVDGQCQDGSWEEIFVNGHWIV